MAGIGWRLARRSGSGTAQLPLAICGVIAVVIVLLGKAESSIFDSARARFSDLAAPVLAELRAPLASFDQWTEGVSKVFVVYRENLELKKENAELRKWQNVALLLERRMQRYELLLSAVSDPEIPSVTARVIGESSRPFIRTMMLNVGSVQNVKKGQAVLDDRGFLGRIYLTGERTAWVILLTDLNSRVPVRVASSNRRAILAGDNSPAPNLELDVGNAPVKEGDRVVSTGDGGLLPPDLPVGVVVGSGRNYRVALYANPDLSDYVHVMDYSVPKEPPADQIGDLPVVRPPDAPVSGSTPAEAPVSAVKPPPHATIPASRPQASIAPQAPPAPASTEPANPSALASAARGADTR